MTELMEEPRDPRKSKGTVLMGGGPTGTTVVGDIGPADAPAPTNQHPAPVVGWLAVIAGPGRGRSVEISFGMNIAGTGAENRLVLDFGDGAISKDDQFRIAYDSQNKQFHLVPGRGTNLVYLNGQPLMSPQVISEGCNFTVGDTTLRFVPLCTKDWDWSLTEGT